MIRAGVVPWAAKGAKQLKTDPVLPGSVVAI